MDEVAGVTNLKVEPQVLVPQLEVRLRPEAAARFGLTAGARPPRGDHAGQGDEGRRGLRGPEDLRRRRLGRAEQVRDDVSRLREPADRDARRGRRCRSATWPTCAIVPAPNEIKREKASRRLDVTCNVKGRDLGARRPRDRGEGAGSSRSTASTTPSSSASTRPAQESTPPAATPWPRCRSSASCCCIYVDFRPVAADAAGRPDLARSP